MTRESQTNNGEIEQVLLVGVQSPVDKDWEVKDSLAELGELVATAGAAEADRVIYRQRTPHPGTMLGRGKVGELVERAEALDVDTLVFDEDLSPAQGRNIEKITGVRVVDRTQVILDIFSDHANSRAGRLQVELARLQYLLPRLRRMWTHLERQKGGIGLRGGMGEQQIEVDRRVIETRINRIRRDLRGVERHRAELRRGRRRHGWALISLVGYTNAGKSTLMNQLTRSKIKTENALFVTLDPTTRQLRLPNQQSVLLTDTVGFIRKLPHHLIEAFKATLEEVIRADLLVHVVDASHPMADRQVEAVEQVLRDLEAHHKPVLGVLNKSDEFEHPAQWRRLAARFDRAIPVSAKTGAGMEDLERELCDLLKDRNQLVNLRIPLCEAKLLSSLRAAANIQQEEYADGVALIKVRIPPRLLGACKPFILNT